MNPHAVEPNINLYNPRVTSSPEDLTPEAMEDAHEAVQQRRLQLVGVEIARSDRYTELLYMILNIEHASQLTGVARAMTMALAKGAISNFEYSELDTEFQKRRQALICDESPALEPQTWSPSDILDRMPPTANPEADWRVRQLPRGDRE